MKTVRIMRPLIHLARDSSDPSSVRSVGSDVNQFIDGLAQNALVEQRLAAYEVLGANDHTQKILNAFVNEFPQVGALNLRKDILECSDDRKIQQLANHLVSAILVPCIYFSINLSTMWRCCRRKSKAVAEISGG